MAIFCLHGQVLLWKVVFRQGESQRYDLNGLDCGCWLGFFFLEKAQRWVFPKVLRDPKDALLQTKCQQGIALSRPWPRPEGCFYFAVVWGNGSGLMGTRGGQAAHQIQHHNRDRLQIVTIAGKVRNQLAKRQSPEHAVPSLSHQRETKGAPSQLDIA